MKAMIMALVGALTIPIASAHSSIGFGSVTKDPNIGISEYRENGHLVARIEYSGQISLFGVTSEHAAEVTWGDAPEYMHDSACRMDFTYVFYFADNIKHETRNVGLKPDGAVGYTNVAPTSETAAYFKRLAELAACHKAAV